MTQDRFKTRFDSVLAASCCAKISASVDAWHEKTPTEKRSFEICKEANQLWNTDNQIMFLFVKLGRSFGLLS